MKLLLLALVALFVTIAHSQDIVVAKTLLTMIPVAEQNLTVCLKIFNVGKSAIYDITIDDTNWPKNFKSMVGLQEQLTWDTLKPGQNLTHTYAVMATYPGVYITESAKVTYARVPRGEKQISYSSSLGPMRVWAYSEAARRTQAHLREWGIFGLLTLAASFVPGSMYLYISLNYRNGVLKRGRN
mmetsp:Transcript_11481/g.12606  ORF Transcript_11481/g.12606 Transcript_11481/m.12606 type:complete len:184 (-) Transcript_11481:100-651(-)